MSDNQIEEVKSKTDIVSLLSEYLELKKAGRNYKANCPFHGEKTPSLSASGSSLLSSPSRSTSSGSNRLKDSPIPSKVDGV